jgi:L-aminoadipate-semialdehyde dehydrogenase
MKKENIFLTGATGFLGSYLLKILLVNGHKVYALARSKKNTSGENRVLNLLKFWDLDIKDEVVRKNLEIVNGDIASPNLGVSEEILKRLEKKSMLKGPKTF